MAYAHYWYINDLEAARRALPAIARDFQRLLPHLPPLAGPSGRGRPEIGPERLAFNGPAGEGREAFVFSARAEDHRPSGPRFFRNCRTDQKPFDLAVQAALLLAKLHLGEGLELDSDGTLADWVEAALLLERRLALPVDLYGALDRHLHLAVDAQGLIFLCEAPARARPDQILQHLTDMLYTLHDWPFRDPYRLLDPLRVPQEQLPQLYLTGNAYAPPEEDPDPPGGE